MLGVLTPVLDQGVDVLRGEAAVTAGRAEDAHEPVVRPLAEGGLVDPEERASESQGEPLPVAEVAVAGCHTGEW